MNANRTAKILANYVRGMFTAPEIASWLLYELVVEPEINTGFVSSVGSLPDEIQQAFFQQLQSIKAADYQWIPTLVGDSTQPRDPSEYSEKLRRISALLG